MNRLHKIRTRIRWFFLKNYHVIIALSIILASTTGFFHMQWKYRNRDLIFWINAIQSLYKQYGYLFVLTTVAVLVLNVLIVVFLFAINVSPINILPRLDVRQQYCDFLFMRLLSEVSKIKERELKDKPIVSMDSFIKAHEEIHEHIANFRKDARKLLAPNENEVSLPWEEIYDTESEIIDKKFLHITLGVDTVKELINS